VRVIARCWCCRRSSSCRPILTTRSTLRREFAGCDVVVNLIGILNERGFGGRGFHHTHTELPRRALAACRAAGVRRYVHMSSLQADAERAPSHYLRSKGAAERLARR
jgi:NADH dehydrogenase